MGITKQLKLLNVEKVISIKFLKKNKNCENKQQKSQFMKVSFHQLSLLFMSSFTLQDRKWRLLLLNRHNRNTRTTFG